MQGSSTPFFYNPEGVVCSKTGDVVHLFKKTNKGEIIGKDYYNQYINYKYD